MICLHSTNETDSEAPSATIRRVTVGQTVTPARHLRCKPQKT
jgi:hypothetical protein